MSAQSASKAATYLLEPDELADAVDLVKVLRAQGVEVAEVRPALIDAEGVRTALPGVVFEALRQVVTAMANGQGITSPLMTLS